MLWMYGPVRKYMLSATTHLKEENFYQELKAALDFANKGKVKEIFKYTLEQDVVFALNSRVYYILLFPTVN